ncbi:TetR/AcrR family transcriptional regulator [Rhizobium sp. Root1204]|uniref:TetR/AcrR family transcriptional regulator n=1 Tax=Rhizobium sp. Root1204 TaxID=1736428 RepID=UPI0007141C30|nr:TetR/AcrR family transcriptional regulator [Rhizobium sp. Root1204]KQV41188.1 hypothetical protein ASC96_17920 [Rhizobium sp. Root1204]
MRTVDTVKHEKKRREILDASERCFARDGFQGASIAKICAEAGISPGHLYHYFASKEEIIAAIAEMQLEDTRFYFEHMFQGANAIDTLISEIGRNVTCQQPDKGSLFFDLVAEASRNPALASIVLEKNRTTCKLLADLLRRCQLRGEIDPDLDPDAAAALLFDLFNGLRTWSLRDPELDLGRSVDLFRLMVARFLTPSRRPSLQG